MMVRSVLDLNCWQQRSVDECLGAARFVSFSKGGSNFFWDCFTSTPKVKDVRRPGLAIEGTSEAMRKHLGPVLILHSALDN